ncbi:MBL fold metallo-hydrolase [Candidatus Saccharibacteria bacterium]|nr:MBL fold metallo-hydrolase [Candidatus Saccharibacteria bacterium]
MFDLEYGGGNNIKVTTKGLTLVFDAKRSVFGGKDVVVPGGVEFATESRLYLGDKNYKLNINGPGEYEVGSCIIKGIAAKQHLDDPEGKETDSTIYTADVAGFRLAILGNIWGKLTDKQLERIGVIDILVLPVGGRGYTLDAEEAVALTRQIDPKIVIPVHYAGSSLNYEVAQDTADEFIDRLKAPVIEAKSLKLKSGAPLPSELEIHKLSVSA